MSEFKETVKIQNIEQPSVQELLNRFKKRHEMNVVDVAEIISKLITTLKVDHEEGRHKTYSISVGHLGEVLGIGKGVISQFMSVWNMPEESKNLLRNYNLSLINAYKVSVKKGKDKAETINIQKKLILEEFTTSSRDGSGKRTDVLLHAINSSEMILKSVCSSNKIPKEIFKGMEIPMVEKNFENTYDHLLQKVRVYKFYVEQCINYLSPKISKLPYLKRKLEFFNLMSENNDTKIFEIDITIENLNKQIKLLSDEIVLVEAEQKLPNISQLLIAKSDLEKNI